MLFRDIIGQEATKEQLCRSVREGRIAHAQLFAGISGIGKLQLALAYAQYLNCPKFHSLYWRDIDFEVLV